MNTVTKLHHKSLAFSDEAIIAKRKGDIETAKILFEKAFWLEQTAAKKMNRATQIPFSQIVMIRSAAALAYKAGLYQEALKLIAFGFKEYSDNIATPELQSVLEAVKKEMPEIDLKTVHLKGVLTAANANDYEIKIENLTNKMPYSIIVPSEMMDEIVRSYWKNEVLIEITSYTTGIMVLDKISLAA